MKSISKRKVKKPAAAKAPTMYRVLVIGKILDAVRATMREAKQTYALPASRLKDADHAKREALRLAAREHPTWREPEALLLAD